MVSHKYKVIFIHIPKTGGETVISLFNDYDDEVPKHATAAQVRDYLGESKWNEYFKFSFVRNPYSMALSMYSHLRKPLYERRKIFNKYGTTTLNPVNACKVACSNSFNQYCREVFEHKQVQIEQQREMWPVNHFLAQKSWISSEDGHVIVDFVGRFENYHDDLKFVLSKLNQNQLKFLHKNKSKHKHYSKYYDKNSMKLVARHYYEDLQYFNYAFEDHRNFFDRLKLLSMRSS
jgi:chondroitin 4-sulfotransferase 11